MQMFFRVKLKRETCYEAKQASKILLFETAKKKPGEIKRFWKYGKLNASWGFHKQESSKLKILWKFLWIVWSL